MLELLAVSVASSGTGSLTFAVLGAAGGFLAVFLSVYFYYRNTNKHYRYEHETHAVVKDVQQRDTYQHRITKTKRKRIEGDNVSSYRSPLARLRQ